MLTINCNDVGFFFSACGRSHAFVHPCFLRGVTSSFGISAIKSEVSLTGGFRLGTVLPLTYCEKLNVQVCEYENGKESPTKSRYK